MKRFGGGCHIKLEHHFIRKYVEDGTPKIHFIHLKDILEEPINYHLRANKFDFIVEGRISQIKPYWMLRVKKKLFLIIQKPRISSWPRNSVIGRYHYKYVVSNIGVINIRKWDNWWLITDKNNINMDILGQCIGRK